MTTINSSVQATSLRRWLALFASILMAVFVFAGASRAQADVPPFGPPVEAVPGLTFTGLTGYQGKYLTALYVNAWAPAVKTDNRQILVNAVLKHVVAPIIQDSVVFQAAEVEASGVLTFNHVILVVHDQPAFTWKNANDPTPAGPNNAFVALTVLSKGDIEKLVSEQGNPNNVTIP